MLRPSLHLLYYKGLRLSVYLISPHFKLNEGQVCTQ